MYTNVVENWPDFLICRMKECTALWSKTGQNFSNVEWKNVQQCGWGDSQHKLNNSCIPGFKIHCGLHGFLKKWYQRWYTVLKVMENYWTTNKSQVVVKGWVWFQCPVGHAVLHWKSICFASWKSICFVSVRKLFGVSVARIRCEINCWKNICFVSVM